MSKRTLKLGLLAAGAFGACCLSPVALAQSSDAAAEDRAIEEVVVTARRREETVQTVPIPVTALGGDELRDRVAEDLRDLTRLTPNLDFQRSASNKNTSQIFLRGIGQVNWAPTQDPKIGTYMNGVYLGRAQGGVFDLMDIERVEVLRGPQGTLFGRNTTAGLVHVISNRPTDQFDYALTGGGGVDGILKAEAMVNMPLSDTLAMRFAVLHRQSDGYVENTATDELWNDENAQHLRWSLRATPSDRATSDLIIDYQRAREKPGLGSCEWAEPDIGATSTAFLPSMAFVLGVYDEIRDTCNATTPYRSSENDPAVSNVDAWSVTLDANYDLGWADLTSIMAYRSVEDQNSSWGWASDTVGTASFLEVIDNEPNEASQWSVEFRLAGVGMDDALNWEVGVYMFGEEAVNDLDVPLFRDVALPSCTQWPVFCLPVPNSPIPLTLGLIAAGVQAAGSRHQVVDASNTSQAVFGEVTWEFMEDWSLTAGARLTQDGREFERTELTYPARTAGAFTAADRCPDGTPPVDGTTCFEEQDFSEVTPRVILSWQATEDLMAYAGWTRGYSSGGFNQDVRMRPFEPELSGNWEGGFKSLWLDNRFLFNLTLFHNTYENQQITVGRLVDGNPTADLINAQQATLQGVEGTFRAELPANWHLQGNFGVMSGGYDEFTVEDNQVVIDPDTGLTVEQTITRDLKDTEVVRGPDHTYSVALGKTLIFGDGATLTGQVGWSFRGRSYNTLETFPSSRQGKYGLMDATLAWFSADGKYSIALWGSNLLDRVYYNAAIDLTNGPSRSGTNTKYWGEPRRFGLEFTYRSGG